MEAGQGASSWLEAVSCSICAIAQYVSYRADFRGLHEICHALASSQGQNLDSEQPNGIWDALASSQGQDLDSPEKRGTVVCTEAGKSTLSVLLAFDLS